MFPDSFADGTRKHLVHHTSFFLQSVPVFLERLATSICRIFFFSFFVQDFCERIVGEGGTRVAFFFLFFFLG
jgi:hypothetical protein